VLSDKAANGKVMVIDGLDLPEIKTKSMVALLDALQAGKSVVVTDGVKQNVVLSSRNIPGVITTPANILSVYDIVNAKSLVVDKAALATIEEVYQ
jgi:large subunit ribosomal protein L4